MTVNEVRHIQNSRDTIPIRPTTNQVLRPIVVYSCYHYDSGEPRLKASCPIQVTESQLTLEGVATFSNVWGQQLLLNGLRTYVQSNIFFQQLNRLGERQGVVVKSFPMKKSVATILD